MSETSTIRYLLVDDESLARQRLHGMVSSAATNAATADWICIGEAENGSTALDLITRLQPDVVFLDIRMPGLSGFEVLEQLSAERPAIVFVTAYDDYALQAFEQHALDYITKPVRAERLLQCMLRVQSQQYLTQQAQALESLLQERERQPLQRVSVHHEERIRIVSVDDIERVEAEDKSVFVYSKGQGYRCDFRLDELEQRLDNTQFLRIHRSHLVRLNAIRELIPWFSGSYCVKLDDGTQLPVARRRVAALKLSLGRL